MDENAKKVLERLESQCSKRECCKLDVRMKALKALDDDSAAAGEIVESLVRDKFVDNLRYASAFAREKSSLAGWGPVKIRFALRAKGIEESDIAAALEDVDSDKAGERLRRLLEQKAKSLQGDPQIRLKLIKFALSRGYEYKDIEGLV